MKVVDFAQHMGDAVCARMGTSQSRCIGKSLHELQPVRLLQSARGSQTAFKFFSFSQRNWQKSWRQKTFSNMNAAHKILGTSRHRALQTKQDPNWCYAKPGCSQRDFHKSFFYL